MLCTLAEREVALHRKTKRQMQLQIDIALDRKDSK